MGYIVGIDLGTTNSAIAVMRDNRPEIITNSEGNPTTPSMVGINPDTGELVIGDGAKRLAAAYAVVREVKRLMGSGQTVALGGQTYTPQGISALILKKLKQDAEVYLAGPIDEAVITVPAYFTEAQRQATKEAGELAGLRVERIINEPTAASLAFGLNNMDKRMNILVYDLGGGTFDVSVVELFEGVLEVKASAGNPRLGGADFDQRIIDKVAAEFKARHGVDLLADQVNAYRLKEQAEAVKILLSSAMQTTFVIPFLGMIGGQPVGIDRPFSRAELESLLEDLLQQTRIPVERALREAGLRPNEIDEVVLVGGSTRIPRVRTLVEEWLGQRPKWSVNPDQSVALGAAIQGAIKSGQISEDQNLVVVDVSPFSLGVDCLHQDRGLIYENWYSELIAPNTTLPCSKTDYFNTVTDNQSMVNVRVFQGQGGETRTTQPTMTLMMEFALTGIPPAPAGEQQIAVSFQYNLNGLFEVTTRIVSTGHEVSHRVQASPQRLTDTQRRAEAAKVQELWVGSELAKRVQSLVYRGEQVVGGLGGAERTRGLELIEALKRAVLTNDQATVDRAEEVLTDFLFDLESR